MIIRDVNLETVCGITSKMPDNILPEFAFQVSPMWESPP